MMHAGQSTRSVAVAVEWGGPGQSAVLRALVPLKSTSLAHGALTLGCDATDVIIQHGPDALFASHASPSPGEPCACLG